MISKQLIRNILLFIIAFSLCFKIRWATPPILIFLVLNLIEIRNNKNNNFTTLFFSLISFIYFSLFSFSYLIGYNEQYLSIIKNLGFVFIPTLFLFYNNHYRKIDLLKFQYFFIFFIFIHSLYLIINFLFLANEFNQNLVLLNERLVDKFIVERPYLALIINIGTVSLITLSKTNKVKKLIAFIVFIIFNLTLILIAAKIGVFINFILLSVYLFNYKSKKFFLFFLFFISVVLVTKGSYFKSRIIDVSNDPRALVWSCNLEIISNKSFNFVFGNFSNEITKKELISCYNSKKSLESKHFWIGKFNFEYNSHNQYLSVFSNFGFIGLFSFLLMLIIPILFTKNKPYLLVFVFSISCFFENILDRQIGIYLFLWFLLISIEQSVNKKIYINGRFLTQKTTGVQRVALEVVKELQQHYQKNLVVLLPKGSKVDTNLYNFNVKKCGNFSGLLWEQVYLPLFLIIENVEILVNLCNSQPILSRKKNVVVLHDVSFLQNDNWFNWKFKYWYIIMNKISLSKNKAIVTVSEFSKKEILKFYPRLSSNKIKVIYSASFLEYNFNTIDKENQNKVYFLSVASYDPRKNLQTILNAFSIFSEKNDGIELYLVGHENSNFKYPNFIETNRKIKFLSNVTDDKLQSLYKNSIAFVSASLYEGFGLPILEAISQNTICLVSDIEVYKELFADAALFFEPKNSQDLARLMEDVSTNKEKYISLFNKNEAVNAKYSWRKTGNLYYNLLKTLNES